MFALTTVFISFSFFEEGEGLSDTGESHGARAAFNFRHAVGVFTNKFTLGFRAVGLVAFPVASGLFTNGFALRFRSLTVGNAVGLLADSNTLGAVELFTAFIRALDLALRFLAFYVANGILGFGT